MKLSATLYAGRFTTQSPTFCSGPYLRGAEITEINRSWGLF